MSISEQFIKDQFPQNKWGEIPTVLRTAYATVTRMAKDDPILNIESARDNRGRLVSWAVDFGLKRAAETGALDCDFRWREFARPTGRYLELVFSHSTASVSQIADPERQPRNVVFRENARLRNQGVLEFPEFEDELHISGVPHFLIVHGHQTLNFAHLGVPLGTSQKLWSWLSPNLMRIPHEMPSEKPAAEDTDIDIDDVIQLKDDIDKWRRDNGNE